MDMEFSPEQMESVLRLCDILSLEDIAVGAAILQQSDWNLEKAIGMIDENKQKAQAPPPPPNYNNSIEFNDDPYGYDEMQPEQYDYNEYEYEFQKQSDFENKKKMFQNQYVSIPLIKTTSQSPNNIQKKLSYDRLLKENYYKHRHEYQNNLLQNSEKLCQTILATKSEEVQRFYKNKRKNQNNKMFLWHLHNKYKTKINFTFGTFLLNLTRSYLDKKYLLVYVHKSEFEDNKSIEMLLHQKEISNFINKHCISYGMFDSSDDYQIIQKYVPMKNLPAFVLFKFNKKEQKQEFISEYVILKKDQTDFIQWLAQQLGIPVKKKQTPIEQIKKPEVQYGYSITQIVNSQNYEYEEMQKVFQLKRQQSKIKKEEMQSFEEEIQKLKYKFNQQKLYGRGESIQIKFRLPNSGKSLLYEFSQKDKISVLFEYVNCFGRDQFEDKYADFDLTQTFPRLSLIEKKGQEIETVFQGSERQNIIVKEL